MICASSRSPQGHAAGLHSRPVLAALTVLFGVGLMSTAGYLISRAAEQPAGISLTVAIVRAALASGSGGRWSATSNGSHHDLGGRVLGRVRVRVYERLEPLAPAELEAYQHTFCSALSPTSTHCSSSICARWSRSAAVTGSLRCRSASSRRSYRGQLSFWLSVCYAGVGVR